MGYLIDILIGVISDMVTGEFSAHAEPIARWIIDKAVECLPTDYHERLREEWLADLNDTPGTLGKIWHAVGCYLCAPKLAKLRLRYTERARSEKILPFINWLGEELGRLPEGTRLDEPGVREGLVEGIASKLTELDFTENEAKHLKRLIIEARHRAGV